MNGDKILVANWKSHFSISEAKSWLDLFSTRLEQSPYELIVCPPFSLLSAVKEKSAELRLPINLGAQDISPFPVGSYTGAVSVQNLEGLDIQYVLVGHSERRKYFHETSNDVANKITQCHSSSITPIVCVDAENVRQQLATIDQALLSSCVFAYEDPKHIGTGVPSSIQEAEIVASVIRQHAGATVKVLYGGSANKETAKEFLVSPVFNGLLIGSASLSADEFAHLSTLKK